jgi:hypothetical protein
MSTRGCTRHDQASQPVRNYFLPGGFRVQTAGGWQVSFAASGNPANLRICGLALRDLAAQMLHVVSISHLILSMTRLLSQKFTLLSL